MVGITLNTDWQVPKNPNDSKDKAASDRAINFMFGWFLNPVIRGDYPDVMKEQVDRKSKEQGFTTSRLPSFTPNEKLNIKGRDIHTKHLLGLKTSEHSVLRNYMYTCIRLCINIRYSATYISGNRFLSILDISY